LDKNFPLFSHGFARVPQEIGDRFGEVRTLHQQRRKTVVILPLNANVTRDPGGEDLLNDPIQFFGDTELFDPALRQLRVTHDLRDDPVGLGDFLADDLDLHRRSGLGVFYGPLQGKRHVVDDGERILDLMGELGRQPAGTVKLLVAPPPLAVARPPAPARRSSKT
jgi:hypothetical protein